VNKYIITHVIYVFIIAAIGVLLYHESHQDNARKNVQTLQQLVIDRITEAQKANLQPDEIEEQIGLSAHYSTIRPEGADRIRGANIVFEDGFPIRLKEYDAVAIWLVLDSLEYIIIL